MTPPERMRALLAKPDFVVMPAVWDGLSAKLAASAGFPTAFLSGSCVAASRLGGPGEGMEPSSTTTQRERRPQQATPPGDINQSDTHFEREDQPYKSGPPSIVKPAQ